MTQYCTRLTRHSPMAKDAADIIASMHVAKDGEIGVVAADHIVSALEAAGIRLVGHNSNIKD